ncbi:hypothetical protein GE21DRAFT_1627 [Neurospora crassa]|uniref:Uncharacterized protein n=1 Tax=Neurospora crassa (strain ATCC 24698 / 74-OR23-1A / CBS 708.71 / DSM 1257 / FGSC 987) TaxID=367110 RepID=A7UWY1_NEUCR|nr:hypothetical protein NCU11349 [Neurospora crassa OR74A]EDO65052.2 hypothetical protein NCU11349 [Neurospora crassa OR74A]KHE79742.1 hypothetical protein GE21DRAFT_1627 [Neurospora crassa]|eukprot:XP_001728143.2 hypothetical protein NCU11349 [Neurospora crassa OR74A]
MSTMHKDTTHDMHYRKAMFALYQGWCGRSVPPSTNGGGAQEVACVMSRRKSVSFSNRGPCSPLMRMSD